MNISRFIYGKTDEELRKRFPVGLKIALPLRIAAMTGFTPTSNAYTLITSTIADGTRLRDLTGWTYFQSSSSADANAQNRLVFTGGYLHGDGADWHNGNGASNAIVVRDTGSTSHQYVYRNDSTTGDYTTRVIALGAVDGNNYIAVQLNNSGSAADPSITIKKYVAGTATQLYYGFINANTRYGQAVPRGTSIVVSLAGGVVDVSADGKSCLQSSVSVSGVTLGTYCGLGTDGLNTYDKLKDFYIAPITAVLGLSAEIQRYTPSIIGQGADIALAIPYSGTVTGVAYRVVNAATGAQIKGWKKLLSATISGSSISALCHVDTHYLSQAEKVAIEVCATNSSDSRVKTKPTALGYTIIDDGQSNSVYADVGGLTLTETITNLNGYVSGYNAYQQAVANGSADYWSQVTNPVSHPAHIKASMLAAALGVPVGVFVAGVGAQPIDSLAGDTSSGFEVWTAGGNHGSFIPMETLIDVFGLHNNVYSCHWIQGEAEANGMSLPSQSHYLTEFALLRSRLVSQVFVDSSCPILVMNLGRYRGTPTASTAQSDANWTHQRWILDQLASLQNTYLAGSMFDLPMSDEFHMTAEGHVEKARRFALTELKRLGYRTTDGQGPIITGATRSGATITLSVDLNGHTSLDGSALTCFDVSSDDFATLKTISSATVSGSTIVITLAADPGGTVKVRSCYGMNDGYTDPAIPANVVPRGVDAAGNKIMVKPLYTPLVIT